MSEEREKREWSKWIQKEPLYEALQLLGVKPGVKVQVRAGRENHVGVVEAVLPGWIVIRENPSGQRTFLNTRYITKLAVLQQEEET